MSPSGCPHLKDTRSAFLASFLSPLLSVKKDPGTQSFGKIPESHVGKRRSREGVRVSRESNLIPLFILLEFRLALSGAGSSGHTPAEGGG
jgi:hypothetical protein